MDLQTLINSEDAVIVDVREPGEFNAGHLEASINIPLSQLGHSVERYRELGRPLILICHSGNRSGMVTQFLRRQGIKEVYNGGAWTDVQRLISRKAA